MKFNKKENKDIIKSPFIVLAILLLLIFIFFAPLFLIIWEIIFWGISLFTYLLSLFSFNNKLSELILKNIFNLSLIIFMFYLLYEIRKIIKIKPINQMSQSLVRIKYPPTNTTHFTLIHQKPKLKRNMKYLQIALNSDLNEAAAIISSLPVSERILIEVGTPLIKRYGVNAVRKIKSIVKQGTYIVADSKCVDLAFREVRAMFKAGANAVTCLGVAPVETIDRFIEECKRYNLDSMVDMMNVENPVEILKNLKNIPDVVIIHRGVDETEFSKEKEIPFYQINQIKDNFDVLVSIAGGDTIEEIQKAVFNDADIVVVWKDFYKSTQNTTELAAKFLKEIR